MSEPNARVNTENPIEVARETLRRLALSRIAPTPENYRKLYHEIAGTPTTPSPVVVLEALTDELRQRHPVLSPSLDQMEKAIQQQNWPQCTKVLLELTSMSFSHVVENGETLAIGKSISSLFQELLSETLDRGLALGLESIPDLANEAHRLAIEAASADTEVRQEKLEQDLKHLWVDIEMQGSMALNQQERLRGLLQLLIDNICELMDDDSWLSGQMKLIREILQGPARPQMYDEVETRLREVIYKQSVVKKSLREANLTLRATMKSFVDRLGEAVETTGDYQEKISDYAERISNTEDMLELSNILEHVLRETRLVQASTSRTHDELVKSREAAIQAEKRIGELEAELTHMSTLVRIDPMTQSLNRRGMEHEFQKEAARSDRHGTPLCVAMIDIDNFKKLNDTYGHMTGDEVLVHLVQVAKHELRVTDVIGRMGGEEFLILLPNTRLDEAIKTVARVQRGLTRNMFLNNNDRLLITFSAGVALREYGESQESAMERADKGLYEAKRTGKNKVCKAPILPPAENVTAA